MPDRLYFTDSDEANALIASNPMALLVGFALDQQVTVQKAFAGPLVLRERLGAIDAATLASADLEPVFFAKPVIHRYPRSMAKRVHELAVYVRDRYGGDATAGFGVSKPAISRHLKVLEETGVVTRVVEGRTHRLSLDPDVMSEAADWMDHQRALWGRLFDVVEEYLNEKEQ